MKALVVTSVMYIQVRICSSRDEIGRLEAELHVASTFKYLSGSGPIDYACVALLQVNLQPLDY